MATLLCMAGADAPRHLMSANESHETGYWEPLPFYTLNEELLAELGMAWDTTLSVPSDAFRSLKVEQLRVRFAGLLHAEYGDASLLCVKDPRGSRLLPLWLPVLEAQGINTLFVIGVRNPLEVADSLKQRDGFHWSKSLMLWLRYTLEAEQHTRGQRRVFVTYDQVLDDWRAALHRIGERLGIAWPRRMSEIGVDFEQIITDRLRRHRASAEKLGARDDIDAWVGAVYSACLAASEDRESEALPVFDRVRAELGVADRAFEPLLVLEHVRQRELDESRNDLAVRLGEREAELGCMRDGLDAARAALDAKRVELDEARAQSEAELQAVHSELDAARGEASNAATRLAEQQARIDDVNAQLRQRDTELGAMRADRDAKRAELDETRARSETELQAVHESAVAQRDLDLARQQASNAATRAVALQRQVDSLFAQLRQGDEEIDAVRAELHATQVNAARLQAELTAACEESEAKRSSLEAGLASARRELEAMRLERDAELKGVRAEHATELDAARTEFDAAVGAAEARIAVLSGRVVQESASAALASEELAEWRGSDAALRRELDSLRSRLKAREAEVEALEASLADARAIANTDGGRLEHRERELSSLWTETVELAAMALEVEVQRKRREEQLKHREEQLTTKTAPKHTVAKERESAHQNAVGCSASEAEPRAAGVAGPYESASASESISQTESLLRGSVGGTRGGLHCERIDVGATPGTSSRADPLAEGESGQPAQALACVPGRGSGSSDPDGRHPFTVDANRLVLPVGHAQEMPPVFARERARIAVHCHYHYMDCAAAIAQALQSIPESFDLYASFGDVEGWKVAEQLIRSSVPHANLIPQQTPNRGRNVAPLLATFNEKLLTYEYALHIHTKMSVEKPDVGKRWFEACLSGLLHDRTYVQALLDLFDSQPECGIVMPVPPAEIVPLMHWGGNRRVAEALLVSLGVPYRDEIPEESVPFAFPAGFMFWFRPAALRRLLSASLCYEDFPPEPLDADGTTGHAIERILLIVARAAGYWKFYQVQPAERPPEPPGEARQVPLERNFEAEAEIVWGEFDPAYYLAANQDVQLAGVDPLEHFLEHGWREGRNPNVEFSVKSYLSANPDVAEAGVNPFIHYLTHGRLEKRPVRLDLGFRYDVVASLGVLEEYLAGVPHVPEWRLGGEGQLRRALSLLTRSDKRKLHVSVGDHSDYVSGTTGLPLCVRREADAFERNHFDHIHLRATRALGVTDHETGDPAIGIVVNGSPIGSFRSTTIASVFRESIGADETWGTRTLAIHSLLGHSPQALIRVLKSIPLDRGYFWIHDFAGACAGMNLLRNDVEFCGGPPLESTACTLCVYGRRRAAQVDDHRTVFGELRLTAVAPSRCALNDWKAATNLSTSEQIVHPHCLLVPRLLPSSRSNGAVEATGALKVAYLGFPASHKGWPVFRELAVRFRNDERYAFFHLGSKQSIDAGLHVRFREVFVDSVLPNAMVAAIEELQVDVVLLWSLCHETFSLTAHEAISGGAVIVARTDSGNLSDLVHATRKGRVLPDERSVLDFFESGEACELARSRRPVELFAMEYSGLTADLVDSAALP